MADDIADVEVLIIGGGPVGLISAIQLGRAGIKTLLLERRDSFSVHAKAGGIHARTMEVYRQLDLATLIRDHSEAPNGILSMGWMTRLNGIELGGIVMGATEAEKELFSTWSPETMAICSQDIYEPLFAQALGAYPSVELRLNTPATGISEDSTGVTVEYLSPEHGTQKVRAQYVIAADGVRSPVRDWLGIQEDSVASLGTSANVLFEADLEPYRAGREYSLWWIVNGDTQGAFAWRNRGNVWSYNYEAAMGADKATVTPESCIDQIRLAVGVPDLDVKIISILLWQHDQSVTQQWRSGRIFLAGDAAHRFPPHGGFGMNSGVQDSQNLVWKIVARLRWGAGDHLLDSYEAERKPVAQFNADQCMLNTKRMAETGWLAKDPHALDAIEMPEGAPIREKMSAGIPKQREQFFSQGQQFGQVYRSTAVIDDGTAVVESDVSTYRPNAHPGARAPHVWLQDETGRTFSSIDLVKAGFLLLAGSNGEEWTAAASIIAATMGISLAAVRVGSPGYVQRSGDTPWESLVGVGNSGAVLIRPDGQVAARWNSSPGDIAGSLSAALNQILDRSSEIGEHTGRAKDDLLKAGKAS
jgi:putative polyketide hydroxylase